MPELKRHFRAGRMNKDLDERLVPAGEYRNAENIEIATSEGSDVGAAQNILGNTKVLGKTYNASTGLVTANWSSNYIDDLTSPKCIGSIKDTQNDRIYWFIAATGVSAIAEYDETTNIVSPVLVDKNSILNFSENYLITGINIIEGLLLWTDNQTEPKKIKISTFKSGSTDFNTHTQIDSADFTENDITVIKLSPLQAPTLTMAASKRTGNGTGTSEVFINKKFTDGDGEPIEHQTVISGLVLTPSANYRKDDIITLTHEDEEGDTYTIKLLITKLNNWDPTNSVVSNIDARIQSIPVDTPDSNVQWSVLLDEEQPMFEKKFVRFAYRWKYKDGEYSVFSPFSLPAFLPTDFEYKSTNGYNTGMINTLRSLTINLPDTQPSDVDEVDILYKESNNNLVYTVDTLKNNETSYEIQSEIIGSVVASNQILRPWDNVPRKALAQEITANRLIYGNYYQNYNILKQNLPDIETAVISNDITAVKSPEKSLKSQRTYQIGIVYRDAYGRETPVFSNKKATKQIDKSFAEKVNSLSCKLKNDPPEWATHYKYFIKETSNEYYNAALDRFYVAEDGNVWLSFPSSERNKIQEDGYLILKKQHDKDTFVSTEARYKVLDIQNEAPKSIKMVSKSIANSKLEILDNAINPPQVGATSFQLKGPKYVDNATFADGLGADGVITITTSAGTTDRYKIKTGGLTGETNTTGSIVADNKHVYDFELQEPLKDIESTVLASAHISDNDHVTVKLYEEKEVEKAEFYGRFFVKINRNSTFDTNIIASFPALESQYNIKYSYPVYEDAINDGTKTVSDDGKTKKRSRTDLCWTDTKCSTVYRQSANKHPVLGKDTFTVYWSGVNYGADWKDNPSSQCKHADNHSHVYKGKGRAHNKLDDINPFLNALANVGTFIQFVNSAGTAGAIYEVSDPSIDYEYRTSDGPVSRRSKIFGKRRAYNITIKNVETSGGYDDSFTWASDKITKINILEKDIPLGNEILSSTNPCIFETEPKEAVELDLYHEISDAFPIIKAGMTVEHFKDENGATPGTPRIPANTTIDSITDVNNFTLSANTTGIIASGSTLKITDSKGIYSFNVITSGAISSGTKPVAISDGDFHGHTQALNWFNCYSFGNGVESDRLRDDFNAIRIDKGVKVSMPLAEQYKEEQKQNGLIFSGIFNSTSGINQLNQFIQAEPITKDLNPYYGSIQRLLGRDTDLITFCEDKVLRVLANKDALYEAGGNQQLTATNRVLGQTTPFSGEYGISKNPESLISHANNVFWSDKARGVICSLQGAAVTPISEMGMRDWFKDNLASTTSILGTYNQTKNEYNVTLKGTTDYTVSYNPSTQGWVSFKSYIPESGCSLNNKYYTFKDGEMWIHNNATRNNFYSTQYQSSIKLILNDMPETIKGFKTVNYEGTDARIYTYDGTISGTKIPFKTLDQLVADGYTDSQIDSLDENVTTGWYCSSITTNEATGAIRDFKNKEGKWFNYIKGDTTTLSNLDSEEFSVQGIGNMASISGDTSITGYDIVITLAAETGLTLASVASAGGNQSWSQSGNVITLYDVANGYNLGSLDNLNLTFTADTGYTLPSAQTITSQSPTSFVSTGGNPSWNSSTGVLGLEFTSQTISSADKAISLNLANGGTAVDYSVAGTYDVVSENVDIKSSVDNAYSKNANYLTDSAIDFGTPDNIAFTANSGYYFATTPTCEVITEDSDTESYYTITTANTVTDSDGNVTKVTFTINYKHGAANVTGDKLLFTAKAEKIFVAPTVEITGFKTKTANISRRGDSRNLIIIGVPGATFAISRLIATTDGTTWTDGTKYWWDGNTWELTPTQFTIPASGLYTIVESIASSSTSKRYTWEIEDATISTDFAGTNPIVLYQYEDMTLTFNSVTSSTNIHPGTGSSATAATSSNSYFSLGTPPDDSPQSTIEFTHYIYRDDDNDDVGDYFTINSTGPTSHDITYHEQEITTASATNNSKSVTLSSPSSSIVAGMIVTSDSISVKGTEANVTVSSISGTALTLSSSQAIPSGETLTFSPPDEWDFEIRNLTGAAAADTTATGSGSAGGTMTISAANSAIQKGMHIDGTNMHANASVTDISSDGLTITMSDNASGTMSGTYTFRGIKESSTTDIYVYKITGELEINKYGSKALTSQLIVDNFITPSAGLGGGSVSTTFITIQPGTNLTASSMTRHSITEDSTAHNAAFGGTMTLTGNWDGNTANDVQSGLTSAALSSTSQIQGISYVSSLTFTGGDYSGSGSSAVATGSSTTGEIEYIITIDSNSGSGTASASDVSTGYDFTVNVDGGTFSTP